MSARLGNCRRFLDLVDDVFEGLSVKHSRHAPIGENRADFFDSFTRPEIRGPDQENDPIDTRKGVVQHETFHLSVVVSTPMGARQECPPNLKLAWLRSIPEIP
jgi:hypothetical protein